MNNATCYKCGESGHFARNCPSNNNRDEDDVDEKDNQKLNEYIQDLSLKEESPRSKKNTCFKCNQPGHKASECESGFQVRRTNKVCYKCHKSGHIARDCNSKSKDDENNSSAESEDEQRDTKPNYTRAFTRSSDRRNRCYRCNRYGHIVRDCPESEDRCYNCYKYGHIAKDCTYSQNHDDMDKDARKKFNRPKRNDRTCYNCGLVGHISHDCPESGLNRPVH